MLESEAERKTALGLRQLIANPELDKSDRFFAERCLRRIEHPLRMTILGTDPRYAIALLNLLIGQSVVSPRQPKAHIQFFHSDVAHARLQYRDGTQKRIEGADFERLFEGNPRKVRIYVDLPVLKKLSILVVSDPDSNALCAQIEKVLVATDIALWAGGTLSEQMLGVWRNVPDRLRGHSYLVCPFVGDSSSWDYIRNEFVEVLTVDPRAAQEAKSRPGGVDKVAFKSTGGTGIVKAIKKEIDILVTSALDAGDVLMTRLAHLVETEEPADQEVTVDEQEVLAEPEEVQASAAMEMPAEETLDFDAEQEEILAEIARRRVYSVPLGKIASRSRLLSASGHSPRINQRTVSEAIKNMPKQKTRPVSKLGSKPRVRSRRSGAPATPWSLGL